MTVSLRPLYGVLVFASVLATLGLGSGLSGQEKGDNESADRLDRIEAANQMIALGRKNAAPEAILAGAVLLHQNPLSAFKEKSEDGDVIALPEPKKLLDEAGAMRPKDKALADYIAKLADDFKEEARGAVKYRGGTYSVAAGKTMSLGINFKAKEIAIVKVSGWQVSKVNPKFNPGALQLPAAANLEVSLAQYGNKGATHMVRFTPPKAGTYFLKVKNLSNAPASVFVVSN